MRRLIRCGMLVGMALTAGAQQAGTARFNLYGIGQEIELGRTLAAELEHSLTIVNDAGTSARLTRLGTALAAAANPSFSYRFAVFDDSKTLWNVQTIVRMPYGDFEAPFAEPIALPGGPIFIPVSLLRRVDDEPQLAAVLAHAIAHVSLRHATRIASRRQIIEIAADRLQKTSMVPVFGLFMIARRLEFEADAEALNLLKAAGFDQDALMDFIRALPPARTSNVFTAVPRREDRIKRLEVRVP